MKNFPTLCTLLLLALAACSPEEDGSGTPSASSGSSTEDLYLAGRIRLHGKLIEPPDGALHLVAKGDGMATPLVLKLPLHQGAEVDGAEALDLDFRLGRANGMLGEMPRSALPEKLEVEISWTPDGFVPGIISAHTKRMTVPTGQLDLSVEMYPGAIDPKASEREGERPWPRRAIAPPPGSRD